MSRAASWLQYLIGNIPGFDMSASIMVRREQWTERRNEGGEEWSPPSLPYLLVYWIHGKQCYRNSVIILVGLHVDQVRGWLDLMFFSQHLQIAGNVAS